MSNSIQFKDKRNDSNIYPITLAKLVYTSDGSTAENILKDIKTYINVVKYDSSKHQINFDHNENNLFQIDTTDFIKDGLKIVFDNSTGLIMAIYD